MSEIFKKISKPLKKTLDDLMKDKTVVMGAEIIKRNKELEIQKKQFEDSIEFEQRNRRSKK